MLAHVSIQGQHAVMQVFAPGRLPTATVQTAINEASYLFDVSKGILRNVVPAETQTKQVQDLAPGTGAVLTLGPGQVSRLLYAGGLGGRGRSGQVDGVGGCAIASVQAL